GPSRRAATRRRRRRPRAASTRRSARERCARGSRRSPGSTSLPVPRSQPSCPPGPFRRGPHPNVYRSGVARHARNPRRSAVVPRALAALALAAAVGAGAAVAGTGLVPWPSGSKQAGAQASRGPAEHATTSSPPAPPPPHPSPTPRPEPDRELRIAATGALLTHMAVNTSARDGDGYDFGPLLAPLDDWVAGADLALCHLEVPLVPEGRGPSGFPIFGAPRELAQNLADQGWDGCSTASKIGRAHV